MSLATALGIKSGSLTVIGVKQGNLDKKITSSSRQQVHSFITWNDRIIKANGSIMADTGHLCSFNSSLLHLQRLQLFRFADENRVAIYQLAHEDLSITFLCTIFGSCWCGRIFLCAEQAVQILLSIHSKNCGCGAPKDLNE